MSGKGGARRHARRTLVWVALAVFLLPACSIRRLAVEVLADTLAGDAGAFTTDDDPDFVREALPFGLLTFESLLEILPRHTGLLLAGARGYAAYAYLLTDEADRLDATELSRARELRRRARGLYLRGRDHGLRALDVRHGGFLAAIERGAEPSLGATTATDVPFLYWTGAAWAGALQAAKGDLRLLGELPRAAALVRRTLELDARFDGGAAHEFLVAYEGGRPGGSIPAAREHYRRALELSGGQRASVHLALAESVAVREQNLAEFRALLDAARGVDPDRVPALRLTNTLARRRAAWLSTRIPELFLDAEVSEGKTR